MNSTLDRVRKGLAETNASIRNIIELAQTEGRETLRASENREYTRLKSERAQFEERIAELEDEDSRRAAAGAAAVLLGQAGTAGPDGTASPTSASRGQWVRTNDMRPAAVAREQRFADHEIVRQYSEQVSNRESAVIGQHGSLGQMVRSMSTVSGAALVPTIWASDVIDRARNFAAVLKAGASIVPMDAKIVQIGRLTADPTAAFRSEGSVITASDPTFDNVTLTATSMSALVVGSVEWFQDASNVDEIVTNAIAKAIALQLDLAALYGSITTGAGSINLATPPNPRGVLGALNALAPSSVLGAATNGTAQTALSYWNEILDTIYTPMDANEHPNAMIWNSKAARQYAKAYDSLGQPLRIPADVSAMETFVSNQIPSYTQGTMTSRATDVFVGDWTQLLIGQRLDLNITTLTERYAEIGQVGIVANWRGDIQVARAKAFAAYKCLQGA
jgi:HK97 family phage major capsid protein